VLVVVHGVLAVVSLPTTEQCGVVEVSGQVGREGNIACGPFVFVDVVQEELVEV
jgi:hypothetical protein